LISLEQKQVSEAGASYQMHIHFFKCSFAHYKVKGGGYRGLQATQWKQDPYPSSLGGNLVITLEEHSHEGQKE